MAAEYVLFIEINQVSRQVFLVSLHLVVHYFDVFLNVSEVLLFHSKIDYSLLFVGNCKLYPEFDSGIFSL